MNRSKLRSSIVAGRRLPVGFLLVVLAAGGVALGQQAHWEWPEHPMNLQVLPEDTPPEKLQAVMTGFTRALGVRCNHCHVGEDGKPLSTFDFMSDANPNKDRAREMIRMVGSIDQHLAKIDPSGPRRVEVGCATCHRGRPRPTTLEEELADALATGDAAAMTARYRELRERYYGAGTLDFGERVLNNLGYQLLHEGKQDAALAALRLNAEQYPASANVWDSLAEAYLETGQPELAEVFYRKSLELDPGNANALAKLREIRAKPAADGGSGS